MKTFTTSLLFLASASSVLGHATWQQLWVDGVDQAKTCVRDPPSNSPVSDVTSKDIVCNAGTAGVAGICAVTGSFSFPTSKSISLSKIPLWGYVADMVWNDIAGGEVTVEMHQHNTRDCSEEAIGGAHHGPVIIYMSKVDDATTADGTTGTWFKVAEDGYDAATGKWADVRLPFPYPSPFLPIFSPPLIFSALNHTNPPPNRTSSTPTAANAHSPSPPTSPQATT